MAVEGPSFVQTNSSEIVRELVIAGVGIGLRSIWDVDQVLTTGIVKRILPAFRGSSGIAIYAMHLPSPHANPNVTSLVSFLQEQYCPTPPWRTFAVF
ncbi:MAG: hypothetical protein HC869_18870 [Rhodospirillales bacterium]|nr:hypothetical protein [Rhodospirillales bacterium]